MVTLKGYTQEQLAAHIEQLLAGLDALPDSVYEQHEMFLAVMRKNLQSLTGKRAVSQNDMTLLEQWSLALEQYLTPEPLALAEDDFDEPAEDS